MDFLEGVDVPARTWRDEAREERGRYWTGQGRDAVEVAYTPLGHKPTVAEVRGLWKERHGRRAAPLLLVAVHDERAWLCGPVGEDPAVVVRDVAQAERLAATALAEPSRHFAIQFLANALETSDDDVPGLHNRGLLATHELHVGVPQRADWPAATRRAQPMLQSSGRALVESLGFEVEERRAHAVLRAGATSNARAVAVFLDATEQPDQPSDRFDRQSPVTFALTQAERDGLPYVVAVRGSTLRLYSTATSGAVGQRGRSETYVGLDLPLLPSEMAGYLTLLFSAEALAPAGTFEDIARASQNFATSLSDRLRERIYGDVVPTLATAIAKRRGAAIETKEDLDAHFQIAVTVLFRLLFIAYAEDSRLLPLYANEDYTHHALKTMARGFARATNDGQTLGFNNPLSDAVDPVTDAKSSDLWDSCQALFYAVDQGRKAWGVPPYNGGLFSSNRDDNPAGPAIEELDLANAEIGPALVALLVDKTPDGVTGPIDFRSLSVREFGTIYEGLLESELARADQDLTLDRDGIYVPAHADADVVVAEGEVYLHNRSGARKASGSYFTKPFAVEHLVTSAVLPALDQHLRRIEQLLDADDEASAAEQLFDFRVADIAMGSGHFLTAVVDELEARYAAFLAEHPIPQVTLMLERLRRAARDNLGELAETVEIENSALLRRMIARRCVYGVDLNPISTELARVSMWIHTFVPGLPLSFLDHNLRVGDSLTGIGTLDEAMNELTETGAQAGLFDDPVREALEAAQEPLRRLGNIIDASTDDIKAARQAARDADAAVLPVRDLFDLLVAHRIGEVAKPTITSLDELPEGDVARAREAVSSLQVLHFPVAFPEVFVRERPGFDALVGNPPWEEATVEKLAFWALRFPGLRSMSQAQQRVQVARLEQQRPDLVREYDAETEAMARLRSILHSGPYPGMQTGDPDLYKAFAWRFWNLARTDGRVGIVLPRTALSASGLEPWRCAILEQGRFEDVTLLTNNRGWVFSEVHPQYTVGLLAIHKAPDADGTLRLRGPFHSRAEYEAGKSGPGAQVSAEEFASWTPTAAFPLLPTEESIGIFSKMRGHTRFADLPFRPVAELHGTNDKKHMILDGDDAEGLWPVYGGSSFNLWTPDTGKRYAWADPDYITEVLQQKRERQVRTRSSAMYGMPEGWLTDPATLPIRNPRIAFRDITNRTNQRTLIACLVPPRTALVNSAPYLLRRPGGTLPDEAYLLGLLSSVPVDWQLRRTVETHVNFFVLAPIGLPWPADEHPGRRRVAELAGRLAAVDDRYRAWAAEVDVEPGTVTSDAQQATLIAELDACVARLYGLDEVELVHVFETFHRGWDYEPRLEQVLEHFRRLDWPAAEPAATSEVAS